MTNLVIVSSNVDVTTKYCRKKDSQHCVTAPFLLQFIMTTATISTVVTLFGLLVKLCCLFLIFAKLQTFLLCHHNPVLLNLIVILLWKNIVVNFFSFSLFLKINIHLHLPFG